MKKINESFTCIDCEHRIPLANKTCRNHCPACFVSLHVDGDVPGDRAALCGGKMYPTQYIHKTKGIKILFVCSQCGKEHRNKQADDDDILHLENVIEDARRYFV